MWNNLKTSATSLMLRCNRWIVVDSRRTTYVLRRTRPVKLNKMGDASSKKLKKKSYYYELIENTDCKKKPELDLILTKDIPGVGMIGENIKTNCYAGYRDLLLPRLAVYAGSPEAQNISRSATEIKYSSTYSKIVQNYLSRRVVPIFLNETIPWTLEQWHIKFALRRAGIMTADTCITLPQKKISGPGKNMDNKDFIVKLIMNKSETILIRCRICLSSKNEEAKNSYYLGSKGEPLFPEDKEQLDSLTLLRSGAK